MTRSIQRLGYGFLVAFVLVALTLGYWGLIRRDNLIIRPDNPRRVLDEQRIQRGVVVDRDGDLLASSAVDPTTNLVIRTYPYPAAAPIVGYYSLRYGVGGIEAEYDAWLRGDATLSNSERVTNDILNRSQVGGDVQLTLDLDVQKELDKAMTSQQGTAIVISVPQGEVLALSSTPAFDANQLDELWDDLRADPTAPLLNRATQGLYQPGTILQSILLGAALNQNSDVLTDNASVVDGSLSLTINGDTLPCAGDPPENATLRDAYLWSCPAPFQVVATQLTARRLDQALVDFGLLTRPDFALPTEDAGLEAPPAAGNLSLTASGQGDLTATPLQMVRVAAAFANNGQLLPLRLVLAERFPYGEWLSIADNRTPRSTISPEATEQIANLMRQSVRRGAAQGASLRDYAVSGHTGLALSGPEGQLNAWFIGFASDNTGQKYAVAVLLENVDDVNDTATIGGQALLAAIARP